MAAPTIGLLSPGDMGHTIGAMLRRHGARLLTCLAGRSERTRTLAATAGFEDTPTLEELVRECDILLSVLVPASARDTAQRVSAAITREGTARGRDLLYADCNAIAPRTVTTIGEAITGAGARFADVGIIGPPPRILQGAGDLFAFVAETPIGKESPESRDAGRDLSGVVRALADDLTAGRVAATVAESRQG